jgi:4a-hydroxytetrahydrobiopterin dehydratase
MPRAPLLDDQAVQARLETLQGWARREKTICKTFRFDDFRGALDFVVRMSAAADEQDHHPDVFIHWNELTLTLWTHASGGLTERDFRLAATIDQMEE